MHKICSRAHRAFILMMISLNDTTNTHHSRYPIVSDIIERASGAGTYQRSSIATPAHQLRCTFICCSTTQFAKDWVYAALDFIAGPPDLKCKRYALVTGDNEDDGDDHDYESLF